MAPGRAWRQEPGSGPVSSCGHYARAGIADYWIVNLVDRVVEAYREPGRAADVPYGARYLEVRCLRSGAAVAPLAAPTGPVLVADLLP